MKTSQDRAQKLGYTKIPNEGNAGGCVAERVIVDTPLSLQAVKEVFGSTTCCIAGRCRWKDQFTAAAI